MEGKFFFVQSSSKLRFRTSTSHLILHCIWFPWTPLALTLNLVVGGRGCPLKPDCDSKISLLLLPSPLERKKEGNSELNGIEQSRHSGVSGPKVKHNKTKFWAGQSFSQDVAWSNVGASQLPITQRPPSLRTNHMLHPQVFWPPFGLRCSEESMQPSCYTSLGGR